MTATDVAILGSGFASSLCAAIIAKRGRSVTIIDRGRHPRFAIGESTTPAADFLLHHLAVQYDLPEMLPLTKFGSWLEQYPRVRCGCKRGFSYVWHGRGDQYSATTDHQCELMVTANASRHVADTQWYRPDVDSLFLQIAKKYGVHVIEDACIDHVSLDSYGNHKITFSKHGERQTITSPFVIDGSGPNSVFMQRWGGDDWTHRLVCNTSAIYGHFDGGQVTESWLHRHHALVNDFPYPFDQAAVHHLFHDGWLWQIGFDDGLTSIGFVTNHMGKKISKNTTTTSTANDRSSDISSAESASDAWRDTLNRYPVLKEMYSHLACATFPGRLFHIPRLQRLREKAAGPNWAALSFTAGFIDPLHSTGIAHTLSTVERICDILLGRHERHSATNWQEYSNHVVGEIQHIDKIIACCYHSLKNFELFSTSTMMYFAAAIALERHRGQQLPTGFLLARDQRFQEIVDSFYSQVWPSSDKKSDCEPLTTSGEVTKLVSQLQTALRPYDDVGLFAPETRNMILHTTAAK